MAATLSYCLLHKEALFNELRIMCWIIVHIEHTIGINRGIQWANSHRNHYFNGKSLNSQFHSSVKYQDDTVGKRKPCSYIMYIS